MSPDSPETRIGRLEQQVSALKQQLSDVIKDVETLDAARMAIVKTEVVLQQVEREIAALKEIIVTDRQAAQARGTELAQEIKDMREDASSQAKASKAQLWVAATAIITTLLTVGGGLIAAGGWH
jgi:uncharacterized protein (UPF0335 family)